VRLTCCHIITLLILCVAAQGQGDYLVRGRVVDAATGKTIEKVNIQIQGTYSGTTTSMEGEFHFTVSSLPITLIFSHISYETKTMEITAFDAKEKFTVQLFTRINLLKEALVTSQHKFASAESVITVLDFYCIDENILILLFNHTKKTHELVLTNPFFDTIAYSGKYTEKNKPQFLHQDCLRECHVYDKDFARQVVIRDSIILLMYTVHTAKFHQTLDDCLFETRNFVVFEKQLNDYYQQFYGLHKETSDERMILSADEMKKARALGEEINFIISHPEFYTDIGAAIRFEREIMFKPSYKVLKKIGDSVYYFNHLSASIDIYDSDLWYQTSIPISYHEQRQWQKEILVDPIEDKAYTTFRHGGKYELHEINLEDGNVEYVTTIPFAFPYKIMVNNGFLYVLYRNLASSWDKKSLYWIRL